MQHVCSGGIAVAQQIAQVYQENHAVAAVMVGGSVARGVADPYSDLEIGVFWHRPPTDDERQQVIAALDSELWSFTQSTSDPTAIVSEHYGLKSITLNGQIYTGLVMVDTKHATVEGVEGILEDVLQHFDTTLDKHILLAAIEDGIAIVGTPLLTTWRARAQTYPLQLAVKVIQEHLWFGPWFIPQAYIQRDDQLVLHQHIIWMQQNLLQLLAGLNRRYYRSAEHKWMQATIDTWTIAPINVAVRLKQILQAEPATGVEGMFTLIQETIALIEEHCPEVNQLALFAEHPEITTTWAKQRWIPQAPYSLLATIGAVLKI